MKLPDELVPSRLKMQLCAFSSRDQQLFNYSYGPRHVRAAHARSLWVYFIFVLSLFLIGCDERASNNPYPADPAVTKTFYTAFSSRPKHLDPARSYSSDEAQFLGQIYEPLLEYSYLLRPYQLQPLTAEKMPQVTYDAKTNTSTYTINIKHGIMYQPHPAFACDSQGRYYYHNLSAQEAERFTSLQDFVQTGTRELLAEDFVYQVKRLADPTINSPIYGFLSDYIIGLKELHNSLQDDYAKKPGVISLDLRDYNLAGVKLVDKYTLSIQIHGKYAQFKYWLAMNFFAPMPWEVTAFYAQPGMDKHNITLDRYPIGTGPYMLAVNNPQRHLIMSRNPNYREEYFPSIGAPGDLEQGYLINAGKKIPMVDRVIFTLEQEDIPYWDKFLQGYYDRSAISSNNFNSVISAASRTALTLTPALQEKGVRLSVTDTLSTFYWGFNMLDEVVGGREVAARNLRHAISLAFDIEEYIAIFVNDRAVPAQGPIPPGIVGYQPAILEEPATRLQRAKQLMVAAGYPDGISPQTGKPLQIYFDTIVSGDPSEQAVDNWIVKQFNKLGIELVIRSTDYNRFQDKLRNGTLQFFFFGWDADYPDPENFLFLFYGPNSTVKHGGENSTNYQNATFDQCFKRFKEMGDNPSRINLIKQMNDILRDDAPWIWGMFPKSYALSNPWMSKTKANPIANNTLKFVDLDPEMRANLRLDWNKAIIWPVLIIVILAIVIFAPAIVVYIKRLDAKAARLP